jgi:hypothetical protein
MTSLKSKKYSCHERKRLPHSHCRYLHTGDRYHGYPDSGIMNLIIILLLAVLAGYIVETLTKKED